MPFCLIWFSLLVLADKIASPNLRCHAALRNPQAFRVTIFIEPILFPIKDQVDALVKQALKRHDRWDSK